MDQVQRTTQEVIKEDWFGCYGKPWPKGSITPETFSHPAKFSRALIRRIYQHLLDEGLISPGDTILDPFGGSGLGAIDALANGLNWAGNELEQKFVDMGAGCECTGMSKADWVRFYGRWERANWKDGRYWCPRCLSEARQVNPPDSSQLALFGAAVPSTSYARNSGRIPHTDPHHYTGNLELFSRYAKGGARAVLVQGDSRNLSQVLGEKSFGFGVSGLVSSSPYADSEMGGKHGEGPNSKWRNGKVKSQDEIDRRSLGAGYGQTAGQLAAMPEGQCNALISSSPFQNSLESKDTNFQAAARPGRTIQCADYGSTNGQLGTMPEGNLDALVDPQPSTLNPVPTALVSSPMFAGNSGGRGEASREGINPALFDRHSGGMIGGIEGSEGNIGGLPMRGFEAVVSSPVYSSGEKGHPSLGSVNKDDWGNEGIDIAGRRGVNGNYGSTNGQLGQLPEGIPPAPLLPCSPAALVSSAPFANSTGSDDPAKRGGILISDPKRAGDRNLTGTYGVTEGQLGAMVEGLVSSSPYEGTRMDGGKIAKEGQGGMRPYSSEPVDYWFTQRDQTNLGNNQGETFWSAARTIIEESYLSLAPGAVSAWVAKNFIKDGQIKPFCAQWRMLCEAVGFEYMYTIRAWQVDRKGKQGKLEGGEVELKTQFKSFFRLLAEKNGSPPIDYEEVILLRKPL